MKCPRDGTLLSHVKVGSVKLDKCHHCDGLWFDGGELETIRKTKATDIEARLERMYGDPEYQQGKVEGYMRCPRCDGRLQRIFFAHHSAIEIDRCDTCRGLWLDDEELDTVTNQRRSVEESVASGRLTSLLRSVSDWFD